MASLVRQELLLPKLRHLSLLVINIVPVLVKDLDDLIIFLEYQLGAFDLLLFVIVWQEEWLEEGFLSGILSHVREKQLLPSNQLNFGGRKVVVVDAVFRELDGAVCGVELLLRIVKVILM
jgi:hypothetical protein